MKKLVLLALFVGIGVAAQAQAAAKTSGCSKAGSSCCAKKSAEGTNGTASVTPVTNVAAVGTVTESATAKKGATDKHEKCGKGCTMSCCAKKEGAKPEGTKAD